jgi:hypothetical protein
VQPSLDRSGKHKLRDQTEDDRHSQRSQHHGSVPRLPNAQKRRTIRQENLPAWWASL